MKYRCVNCGEEFNEPAENKEIKSRFVRAHILKCPQCDSNNFSLSEHGKLLVDRKAKIEKIKNNNGSKDIV